MHALSRNLATFLMKRFPAAPDKTDLLLWEVFRQDEYTQAAPEKQDELKLASAAWRYAQEAQGCNLEKFFATVPQQELRAKSVLDLGCFTGGRLVYWAERFQFGKAFGIDINPVFEQAGTLFARQKGIDAEFRTGVAENLPYEPDSFDFIVSMDVFEHVQSVEKAMDECFRVLKPGGKLMLSFPQYLQPFESHLCLATRLPYLHWIFPGSVLTEAAYQVQAARGPVARWYALESPVLQSWERLPSLNGTSVARFRRIVRKHSWRVVWQDRRSFTSARKRRWKTVRNLVRCLLATAERMRLLEELFLPRVCFVLEKPWHPTCGSRQSDVDRRSSVSSSMAPGPSSFDGLGPWP